MEICAGLPQGAPLILNGDDELLRRAVVPEGIHAVYAAVADKSCEVVAEDLRAEGEGQRFRIVDRQFGEYEAYIPALGELLVSDALLAYTAATRLGLSAETAARAFRAFQPAWMRQHIRQAGGLP